VVARLLFGRPMIGLSQQLAEVLSVSQQRMPALGSADILTLGRGERVVMLRIGQPDSGSLLGVGEPRPAPERDRPQAR
jgi:hypothetical protein